MTNLSKAERAKYDLVIGSRRQVYNGTAHHTSGGLKKKDLFMTKNGRIVSKSKHFSAKKDNRLVKAGFGTRKGKFGFVMLNGKSRKTKGKKSRKTNGKKSRKSKSRKLRGGFAGHMPLSPSNFDGQGVGTSGVALQEVAGQAGGFSGHMPLSPSNFDGQGVGTSGVALQEVAGQAGGKRRRKRAGGDLPDQ